MSVCLSICPTVSACLPVPLSHLPVRLSVSVSFSCCIQLPWTAGWESACLWGVDMQLLLLPTTPLPPALLPPLSLSASLLMCLTIKCSDSAFDSLLCVANICFSLHRTHCLFASLSHSRPFSFSFTRNLVFLKHTKRTSCCI